MPAPTRLVAALAAGLALMTLPARAEEPSTSLQVRLGAFQPGHQLTARNEFRTGPGLEVGVGRALTPWLDAEASLGWVGTEMARGTRKVPVGSGNAAGGVVDVAIFSRLQLVPLTATARVRWPDGPVRPHLLAGLGLFHARHEHFFGTMQGWGPLLRAGAGLDWHRGDRVHLGLEGWWGWGRANMVVAGAEAPSSALGPPPVGELRIDGLHLLATAGWRL